jgi:glycosyltransferase involved in cell wall biosynthesis
LLAPPTLKEAQTKGVNTDRWFVIPHLVNTHQFAPVINRESIRAKFLGYNVRAEAPVILAVGDLSPGSNKRLDWIVKELAHASTPKNAQLLIAGHAAPGAAAEFIAESKKSIGDRIHLVTNLPSSQMAEVYQAADVFVHAALREPFGIVFLEAMSSGLPVIAHQFPVTEWIVGDGGQIIDMSAPGQLAAVLAQWIGDAQIRAAAGRRARHRAIAEFSFERIIPEYLAMYDELHRRR